MIDAEDITLAKPPSDEDRDKPGSLEIPAGGLVMSDVEKSLIVEALKKTDGNQSAAARLLGVSRQTLIYRMHKYKVE